jgi:RND superfamily putative drug exporter
MDYEVSLLSRVRETYLVTGRPSQAITEGLVQTTRVSAAAAPIMVGAFALSDDVLLKLIGVGLEAAILIDAEVVRMLLVPTVTHLLGDRGRWLSRSLDRILPEAELEAAPS